MFISDIQPHPYSRSDPGSTLVCVTTNVNTACCRGRHNPYGYGQVGEWYYPNGNKVPRLADGYVDFAKIAYYQQVRLARYFTETTPPLGAYKCEVPYRYSRYNASASINIIQPGKVVCYKTQCDKILASSSYSAIYFYYACVR